MNNISCEYFLYTGSSPGVTFLKADCDRPSCGRRPSIHRLHLETSSIWYPSWKNKERSLIFFHFTFFLLLRLDVLHVVFIVRSFLGICRIQYYRLTYRVCKIFAVNNYYFTDTNYDIWLLVTIVTFNITATRIGYNTERICAKHSRVYILEHFSECITVYKLKIGNILSRIHFSRQLYL